MSGYTIHLSEEENIVLSAATVRRLIASGSGDGALLYLALLENRGSMAPERLVETLGWSRERLSAAESALLSCGLVSQPRTVPQPPSADQRPDYTREDVARQLEEDNRFAQLTGNVEQLLGKKLSTPDLHILLGLYDYLGLPCEVIFLLVNHCVERLTARYGAGRRPTMRQIEQEGYAWARMGLLDLDSANAYLMKYAERKSQAARYMAVLRLGQRPPSPSEEKYLLGWVSMGFPPETVELAYDKTMLKCGELRWSYLNKILCNWHEKNLHTVEEVAAGDRPLPSRREPQRNSAAENVERMKKYLQETKK